MKEWVEEYNGHTLKYEGHIVDYQGTLMEETLGMYCCKKCGQRYYRNSKREWQMVVRVGENIDNEQCP